MTQIAAPTATATFVPPAKTEAKDADVKTDQLATQAETAEAKLTEAEVKANAAALVQVDKKA